MSNNATPVIWSPNISEKQAEIVNCQKRVMLIHGPKMSGKTRGVEHLICKHLWQNDRARVIMFAKTVKSAAVAGTYKELVEDVMPEWIGAGFGMAYTKKPSTEAATRTHHFKITNVHGTESECYLFSVEHDQEVEAKVKNIKASMIYFIELSNFKSRKVFDATISQLRSDTVSYEEQMWVADTNPPEEGEDSWIHDLFFKKQIGDDLPEDIQDMIEREVGEMLVIPEDNPFLDDRQWAFLRGSYSHSKDLTARYIEGKWVKDISGGHFSDVFSDERHVIGCIDTHESKREVIMPSEMCTELLSGFDPGDKFMSYRKK